MYSHKLSSNTTLQWGRRADCLTDRSVTLSSGTKRTLENSPFLFFPSMLNMRRIVPFPVAKILESSPRLIGMGFESILNVVELNSSHLWDMWFDAPESGCAMKTSLVAIFPW